MKKIIFFPFILLFFCSCTHYIPKSFADKNNFSAASGEITIKKANFSHTFFFFSYFNYSNNFIFWIIYLPPPTFNIVRIFKLSPENITIYDTVKKECVALSFGKKVKEIPKTLYIISSIILKNIPSKYFRQVNFSKDGRRIEINVSILKKVILLKNQDCFIVRNSNFEIIFKIKKRKILSSFPNFDYLNGFKKYNIKVNKQNYKYIWKTYDFKTM